MHGKAPPHTDANADNGSPNTDTNVDMHTVCGDPNAVCRDMNHEQGEVFTELFAFRFKTPSEYQEWRDALGRCKRRDLAGFTRVWAMDASQRPARKDEPDLVAEEGDAAEPALPAMPKVVGGVGGETPGGASKGVKGDAPGGEGGAALFGSWAAAGGVNSSGMPGLAASVAAARPGSEGAQAQQQQPFALHSPPPALPAGVAAFGGGAAVPWGGAAVPWGGLRNFSSSSTRTMDGATSGLGLGLGGVDMLLNRSLFDPPTLNQTLLGRGAGGAGPGLALGALFPAPPLQSTLSPPSVALGKDKEGGDGAEGKGGEGAEANATREAVEESAGAAGSAGAWINPFLSADAGALVGPGWFGGSWLVVWRGRVRGKGRKWKAQVWCRG